MDEERDYDEDEPLLDEEAVVDMFLGESTRAAELRVMSKQIQVLGEEEAISEFVERSVRMTLQKPREEEFD
ncbi:MAG: hypothetical protein NT023_19095 [Armatimonadetes bacterium]|nr:hypothetical protein [Armatimonadota bacterium]